MVIARRTNRFVNTITSISLKKKENMPANLRLELKKGTTRTSRNNSQIIIAKEKNKIIGQHIYLST